MTPTTYITPHIMIFFLVVTSKQAHSEQTPPQMAISIISIIE